MSYRTQPDHSLTRHPPGLPYIVGNEAAERCSYYGMKAILVMYLTHLLVQNGMGKEAAGNEATTVIHLFGAATYALPMIGAILSDRLFGKYLTIVTISLLYCLGHAILAMFEGSVMAAYVGLAFIAIGAGGIKPCVSAHLGDQYGKNNWNLVGKAMKMFYWSINFGAFFSTLAIPQIKDRWGYSLAFAIPGILMGIATAVFWMGRHKFIHVPPSPGGKLGLLDVLASSMLFMTFGSLFFTADMGTGIKVVVSASCLIIGLVLFSKRQTLAQDDGFLAVVLHSLKAAWSGKNQQFHNVHPGRYRFFASAACQFGNEAVEGVLAVLRVVGAFSFVLVFFALFEQYASSWVRQGEMMAHDVNLPLIGAINHETIQAVNPALVMLLIPLLLNVVFPGFERLTSVKVTALRQMSAGMFIAALSFVAVALIQQRIDVLAASGQKLSIAWQFLPYTIITVAEVMVSATGLEFAYTQAPQRMKSTIMGFWMLTISLGNLLVAVAAKIGPQNLVDFFWLFAGLMGGAAVLFTTIAAFYKIRDCTQGDN